MIPADLAWKAPHLSEVELKQRLIQLALALVAAAGVLVGRAAVLQLLPQPRLAALAHRQYRAHTLIRPRRGALLDRNAEALAINVETQSLAANPQVISPAERASLARLLAPAIHQSVAWLEKRLGESREFVWIKRHLDPGEIRALRRVRLIDERSARASGLHLVEESRRVYPHHRLGAHVLGSVDIDSEGLEGLELALNARLRGEVCNRQGIRDMRGRPTFVDLDQKNRGRDGESIRLSLDAPLQFAVERALEQGVKKTRAAAGTVIVMDAETGEILSLANDPTYDPAVRKSAPDHRRNRAVTDLYEPGSTLKTLLLASHLKNGGHLTDRIDAGHGRLQVGRHVITEAESGEKFDSISLRKLLQVSSNVGAAKLAMRLGAPTFLGTLGEFGLGRSTGIHYPGESVPQLPGAPALDPLTLATMGFGQGLSVTPLQMARAYAAFVNGGRLVTPSLLQTEVVPDYPRILSSAHADELLQALRSVIVGGTGSQAAIAGFDIVGKTGTSQWVEAGTSGYSAHKYVASFIGALLNERHRLVILTLLHAPKGAYYAAETAVPLFREVAEAIIQRFGLEPTPTPDGSPARTPMITARIPSSEVSTAAEPPAGPPCMPDLRGMDVRGAQRALSRLSLTHLRFKIVGEGLIVRQSPPPHQRLRGTSSVTLELHEPS